DEETGGHPQQRDQPRARPLRDRPGHQVDHVGPRGSTMTRATNAMPSTAGRLTMRAPFVRPPAYGGGARSPRAFPGPAARGKARLLTERRFDQERGGPGPS